MKKLEEVRHPIQPCGLDSEGVLRFKKNAIVVYLLNNGGIDLNQIALLDVSQEEQEHFAQLIGYSVSGASSLSYFRPTTIDAADFMTRGMDERDARIKALEQITEKAREVLGEMMEKLEESGLIEY